MPLPIDEAARLYREGYTLRDLASLYRCDPTTVMDALDEAGVERRKVGPVAGFRTRDLPPLTTTMPDAELARLRRQVGALAMAHPTKEEAVTLYRQGMSLAQIGIRYGCGPATVMRILEKANEPRRGRGSGRTNTTGARIAAKNVLSPDEVARVRRQLGLGT